MKKYLRLMRVHHYVKNILIFLPLIFSGQLFNVKLLVPSVCGFFAFSLISSGIYTLNDIKDVESDRRHPTKCKRPIASGAVSVKSAWVLAVSLVVAAIGINIFICAYFFDSFKYKSLIFILIYLALNIAYSLGFKNIPILDIAILVSGFLLRVLYGSAITDIQISQWLYLTVIAISFYLGLGKRRNELKRHSSEENETRKVLKFYNQGFLDKNMYMCLALTIAFYSLWAIDSLTVERIGSSYLVWTVPIVILICMKYSLNVEGDSDGDPVEIVFHDKALIIMCVLYALITFAMIYF